MQGQGRCRNFPKNDVFGESLRFLVASKLQFTTGGRGRLRRWMIRTGFPPSAEPLKSIGRFAPARLSAGVLPNRLASSKTASKRGLTAAPAPRALDQFTRQPGRTLELRIVGFKLTILRVH